MMYTITHRKCDALEDSMLGELSREDESVESKLLRIAIVLRDTCAEITDEGTDHCKYMKSTFPSNFLCFLLTICGGIVLCLLWGLASSRSRFWCYCRNEQIRWKTEVIDIGRHWGLVSSQSRFGCYCRN
jgi:hypothetical protein